MDFLQNPIGNSAMRPFDVHDLDAEALTYLTKAGALQGTPIERLAGMNSPAIDIYTENGIDLHCEPLEIAVCAQHNNGGFAVNKWWESNIAHTFIIGEMAGTHGVKRPGGSALNAGQTGGLRAAEYIANIYGPGIADYADSAEEIDEQLNRLIGELDSLPNLAGSTPEEAIENIQTVMTASGGHIRQLDDARNALKEMVELYKGIGQTGFRLDNPKEMLTAVRARHLALTAIASLKAIAELLAQGSGSRGSHLVLAADGVEIHCDVINKATGKALRFKPENETLRNTIMQVMYDEESPDLFACTNIEVRPAPTERKAFEPAWQDFREGKIYDH